MALVALLGALFYWRGSLVRRRWFLWAGVVNSALPFVAAAAGWSLTEFGRQPWIVFGLLKTAEANSPSVSEAMLVLSLTVIILLYLGLLVVDVWLMRRYARVDPPEAPTEGAESPPLPAAGY